MTNAKIINEVEQHIAENFDYYYNSDIPTVDIIMNYLDDKYSDFLPKEEKDRIANVVVGDMIGGIMKQIDIFGNEEETKNEIKTRKTLKQKFRERHGFLYGKYCGNCKFHRKIDYYFKTFHKCEKLGITSSRATDIRLKDFACKLYEEEKKNEYVDRRY